MVEDIRGIEENEISDILKKIINENELIKKELNNHNEILNSHYQILNIVLSNKFIKANGLLRKLQLHTLEILKFIVNICNKYGFKYWLEFGTLLGAVRHEGFIPWDDEIDIAMPRDDYERFMEILPFEVKRFEGLEEQLNIRKGSMVFKNAEYSERSKTPVLQFIHRKPHAGLEIYPLDFINIAENDPDLINSVRKQVTAERTKFRNNYKDGLCTFEEGIIEGNKNVGITYEKTDFLITSLDGANKKPIHTSYVYPLKKCKFENCEVNIPNDPIEYLATYYSGNIMNIPKIIQYHHFTDEIQKLGENDELNELYEKTLRFWRNINENF